MYQVSLFRTDQICNVLRCFFTSRTSNSSDLTPTVSVASSKLSMKKVLIGSILEFVGK